METEFKTAQMETEFKVMLPPERVGCWVVGVKSKKEAKLRQPVAFYVCDRPKWLHQKLMGLLLGIYWVDISDLKR